MQTTRTIRVTDGAAEYVTGRVLETNGADLTGASFQVGLGGHDAPPAVWEPPSAVTFVNPSEVLVSMLVDADVAPMERAFLWVKTTDTPEVLPRRAEGGHLTVA